MIQPDRLATKIGHLVQEEMDGIVHGFLCLLLENGFTVWAVGGIIRDTALGRSVADIDLVTDKDPVELADCFAIKHGLGYVVLDDGRRIARIVIGGNDRFNTVDVALMQGGSMDDDLRKRDFTINAVAARFDGDGFTIHDPLGGLADLESKMLRPVSQTSMRDDPVRVLRACRFENSHNLAPSPQIQAMSVDVAPLLAGVAGERISQELFHILCEPFSHKAIKAMDRDGSLDFVFPELSPARSAPQNKWHHLDVFNHSIESLTQMEKILANPPDWLTQWLPIINESLCEEVAGGWRRREILKIAALLHDVGKPGSSGLSDEGEITFYGHEKAGESIATHAANRLRLPGAVRNGLGILVKNHLRPFNAIHEGELSQRSLYRFHRALGEWAIPALLHAVADAMATQGPAVTERRRLAERASAVKAFDYIQHSLNTPQPREPLLDGHDIMKVFNLPQGELIGRLLALVEEARALGEITSREEAVELVKKELVRLTPPS
ncbi:MAG: HD domain-containing protein [Nitrospinae bacterium]|nr:HD domain-containing protein [Nitrospinota bacterium]